MDAVESAQTLGRGVRKETAMQHEYPAEQVEPGIQKTLLPITGFIIVFFNSGLNSDNSTCYQHNVTYIDNNF